MIYTAQYATLAAGNPGLPAHDLVAYVAAGIAVLACILAMAGLYGVIKYVRKARDVYNELVEYIAAQETSRLASREQEKDHKSTLLATSHRPSPLL